MFIYESEYQQLTALGADTANNIEGLKPIDFFKAIDVIFQVDDALAFNERDKRGGRPPIMKEIALCPSVYNSLVKVALFNNIEILKAILGLPGAGVLIIPIRLSGNRNCEEVADPLSKGTVTTVTHNKLKPSTNWTISFLELGTGNVEATVTGASDANGKGSINITLPGTYNKPKVKVQFKQLLLPVLGNETLIDEDLWAIAENIVTVG